MENVKYLTGSYIRILPTFRVYEFSLHLLVIVILPVNLLRFFSILKPKANTKTLFFIYLTNYHLITFFSLFSELL